jgi:hypothetical protein
MPQGAAKNTAPSEVLSWSRASNVPTTTTSELVQPDVASATPTAEARSAYTSAKPCRQLG